MRTSFPLVLRITQGWNKPSGIAGISVKTGSYLDASAPLDCAVVFQTVSPEVSLGLSGVCIGPVRWRGL